MAFTSNNLPNQEDGKNGIGKMNVSVALRLYGVRNPFKDLPFLSDSNVLCTRYDVFGTGLMRYAEPSDEDEVSTKNSQQSVAIGRPKARPEQFRNAARFTAMVANALSQLLILFSTYTKAIAQFLGKILAWLRAMEEEMPSPTRKTHRRWQAGTTTRREEGDWFANLKNYLDS
ncbi:hypothetical protein GOBAR_DD02962 [Gossypium barbadense]|nr:hypothetical protein GOBAR_DD02962 [Gossypium barbadense]